MQLYRNIVINAYYQLNQHVKNCTEINQFMKCLLNYIKSTQTRVIIKTNCHGFVVTHGTSPLELRGVFTSPSIDYL